MWRGFQYRPRRRLSGDEVDAWESVPDDFHGRRGEEAASVVASAADPEASWPSQALEAEYQLEDVAAGADEQPACPLRGEP